MEFTENEMIHDLQKSMKRFTIRVLKAKRRFETYSKTQSSTKIDFESRQ